MQTVTLGMWLSLIGGVFELVGIGIATVSAVLAYRRARARVAVLRKSLERSKARRREGTDDRTAQAELEEYRRQRGVEPDMIWDDVPFVRTLITYAVSGAAASSALATVVFLAVGVVFSTAGNLL